MRKRTNVLYIVGPTASGKSALAIALAKKLGGEIICADSRTIYRGLDIATAKPSGNDRATVVHYGLDILEPNERFSAANFKQYATDKIIDVQSRGKLPIVVGGTGLYIDGLLFNFTFGPAANSELRTKLEKYSIEELQMMIADKGIAMPENAKNKRYLLRALEQGGVKSQPKNIDHNALVIGLNPGMQELENRIRLRASAMQKNGALQEAQWLFEQFGYSAAAASAPFFKAYAPYFTGVSTLQECLARDCTLNRQLAKRQLTWFKRNEYIHWFASSELAQKFVLNTIT